MEGKKKLKILLVSNSDSLGGAAIATYRLLRALNAEGAEARMLVMTKLGNDERVQTRGSRFRHALSFGMERFQIALANGFNRATLFKVSTGHWAMGISRHPWVKEADVICLNWINQGLMGVKELVRLHKMGKKIVWTMHDMWCMTGMCHHAYECTKYKKSCGACRFLLPHHEEDLSSRVWKEKHKVYSQVPITFVAVSSWLASKAAESSLLKNQTVVTIPNAFPAHLYRTSAVNYIKGYNREETPNVILFGAARLDEPIKGLDYAIDALNYLFDERPDIANKSLAVFYGDLRDRSRLDRLRFNHIWLGMVKDFKILRHLYANGKIILSTSLYETLLTTLIEGQAGGCIPVAFGRGGQSDIVEHKKNGFIAEYKDAKSVAEGIIWALENPIDREFLHQSVVERFSASSVAKRYLELLESITGGKGDQQVGGDAGKRRTLGDA